ncbi:MAG: hypothetical protein CEO12_673 [Parcubacteria group bacterium Gr01-1014_46]|nr:MAG: hypothetical protein CEO12_673 [Parcubacteria group bacterium Gr01-1014_46]
MIKLLFFLALIILIGFFSYNLSVKNEKQLSPVLENISKADFLLFEEITIPYLKSKTYASKLNDLELLSENIYYTSYLTSYNSDGLKIYGLLTQPKGQMPVGGWPAVIFVHGYIPPQNYQTTVNYSSYVDYLAKSGLVVFKIDLRGHGNSEGEPGGSYYSSDYIIDTLNAYSALQNSDFVNPDKIGLWGHSMAGNVVFRSLAAMPEIPAVVIWAGAVYSYEDFAQFGIDDNSYQPPLGDSERQKRRKLLFDTYGQFNKESDFWKKVAATNYLDGIDGAIQINHAVDDPVVDIGYSRNLMSILDSTTISHELKEYPSGDHNLTGLTFSQAMQNTVNFYKKHL